MPRLRKVSRNDLRVGDVIVFDNGAEVAVTHIRRASYAWDCHIDAIETSTGAHVGFLMNDDPVYVDDDKSAVCSVMLT